MVFLAIWLSFLLILLSLYECANVIQAAPATQHRGLPGGDRLHRLPLPPHGGRPGLVRRRRQQGGLRLELVPELPVALPLRQPEARVRLRPRTGHDGHPADKLNERSDLLFAEPK